MNQLLLSWTSNRHSAALNPGPLPLDDQNFPQLLENTMAAVRAHGFWSYPGTEGSSIMDCCSVMTILGAQSQPGN